MSRLSVNISSGPKPDGRRPMRGACPTGRPDRKRLLPLRAMSRSLLYRRANTPLTYPCETKYVNQNYFIVIGTERKFYLNINNSPYVI